MDAAMTPLASLTLLTSAAFLGAATTVIAFEVERQRARRLLVAALRKPQMVEKAWVSPPDERGLRCLFVKPVGTGRAGTVAMDFEVDEVVRRLSQAGIRISYEDSRLA
jgi:hypothetical protein